MKTSNPKCADNFEIESSSQGLHHEQLHKRIFDLERQVEDLKKQLEEIKRNQAKAGKTH